MTRIAYAAPLVLLLTHSLGCNYYAPADLKAADSTGSVANNGYEQLKKEGAPKPATPPEGDPDWDKKIVKTADLRMVVANFGVFTRRLHEIVKQSGGYISEEEQVQSTTEINNSVTIKVPVMGFDDLLMALPADSDRLVEKKISSQDVTMEVVDTKSGLETKKEVRERYLELLRQAHNMKDILTVRNEINDIQQQMDQASGRIAFLGHSAAFSTIRLHFYQVLTPVGACGNDAPPFFIG